MVHELAFRIVLLLMVIGVLELSSLAVIAMLPQRDIRRVRAIYREQSDQIRQYLDRSTPHLVEMHPVLGWRHAPNYRDQSTQMNALALRSDREYSSTAPAGVLRAAAFGDSFVYCSEVENAACWTSIIEATNRDIELLNYGVGGYGLDQAYLRYLLEGETLSPHVVLLGFMPDDINRTVNVYRRFLARDFVLFKPRYVLSGSGDLTLLEVPVKTPADYAALLARPSDVIEYGRNDHWYSRCVYENPVYDYLATVRLACAAASWAYGKYLDPDRPIKGEYFNEDSTAFEIQVALLGKFADAVLARRTFPLVVMLPDRKSVERAREGRATVYEPLMRYMRERAVPYLDAAEAFRLRKGTTEVSGWFAPHGHYSVAGNEVVASWLAPKLREYAGSVGIRRADRVDHH